MSPTSAKLYLALDKFKTSYLGDRLKTNTSELDLLSFWSQIEAISSKEAKNAESRAISAGLLKDAKSVTALGEHNLGENSTVRVQLKIAPPSSRFSLDLFIKKVSEKTKMKEALLRALAEDSKTADGNVRRTVTIQEQEGKK